MIRDQLQEKYQDILAIFQEVPKADKLEELMELYVEYLKRWVYFSSNHPIFEENPEGFKYGNCYTYAMGYICPDIFREQAKAIYKRMIYDVGFAKKNNPYVANNSAVMLVDNFYKDCEALNIEVFDSDVNTNPSHGGYNILLFADEDIAFDYDFHFLRLNSDGILSEKDGYDGEIRRLNSLSDVASKYELVKVLEVVKPVIRERKL